MKRSAWIAIAMGMTVGLMACTSAPASSEDLGSAREDLTLNRDAFRARGVELSTFLPASPEAPAPAPEGCALYEASPCLVTDAALHACGSTTRWATTDACDETATPIRATLRADGTCDVEARGDFVGCETKVVLEGSAEQIYRCCE